jgi:hypothetical protein
MTLTLLIAALGIALGWIAYGALLHMADCLEAERNGEL